MNMDNEKIIKIIEQIQWIIGITDDELVLARCNIILDLLKGE